MSRGKKENKKKAKAKRGAGGKRRDIRFEADGTAQSHSIGFHLVRIVSLDLLPLTRDSQPCSKCKIYRRRDGDGNNSDEITRPRHECHTKTNQNKSRQGAEKHNQSGRGCMHRLSDT